MNKSIIQWYPGHIAKAEKQLKSQLEKVDLIFEVLDARIPLATSHPHLKKWTKGKKHLLIINRLDMIPSEAQISWDKWFRLKGNTPWWCNAKTGTGVKQIQEAAIRAGAELNLRRKTRGMKSRAIRALTIGFPNVGKSALINRLVKKKIVSSSRRAGVTRSLQWVRLGQELDLLDAPGVLPPKLDNQLSALKLAICDDIGTASYDVESVAVSFLQLITQLTEREGSGICTKLIEDRYGIAYPTLESEQYEWLLSASHRHTSGNTTRMAQRLLDDFRKSFLGSLSLELPND